MRSTLVFAALIAAAPASAGITIDFEAISNGDRPANYYNGGTSFSAGTSQSTGQFGPNLGVVFADGNLVYQRFDACPGGGCSGVFPAGTSGARALTNFGPLSNSPAITTVNIAAGFVGSASVFHYGGASSMQIYRDVGGAAGNGGFGVLLGFVAIPLTTGCTLSPTLAVLGCSFSKYTVNFNGTAQSIVLAGGGSIFDDLTIGAVGNPGGPGGVPEPASWAMLIAGFGLTGAAMRRRRVASGLPHAG